MSAYQDNGYERVMARAWPAMRMVLIVVVVLFVLAVIGELGYSMWWHLTHCVTGAGTTVCR